MIKSTAEESEPPTQKSVDDEVTESSTGNSNNGNPEIDIIPYDETKENLLLDWLKKVDQKINWDAEYQEAKLGDDIGSLTVDVTKDASISLSKRLERFSQALLNPVDGCPGVILTPDQERELRSILSDTPDLLLASLLKQGSGKVSSPEDIGELAFLIISRFSGNTGPATKTEKAVTLGTAMLGTTAVGLAYLKENDVNISQGFQITTGDESPFKSIGITVRGRNIGLSSNNPGLTLSSAFQFQNDTVLTLSVGGSRLTSASAVGSESTSIALTVPVSENARFIQKFSLFGGGSLSRRGEQSFGNYHSGQLNAGLTYHLRGTLTPRSDYGARRFSVGLSVTPFSISTEQISQTRDLTLGRSGASSSANAAATYRVLSPHAIGELGVSLSGGVGYAEEGLVPAYGAGISITITPR